MILFKPYSSIRGFLQRYTLIKVGTLHIRLHRISDRDRTVLFHSHPFDYVSIVLKNGYTETYLEDGAERSRSWGFLSFIKRNHSVYHRIDSIKGETITLFIAWGKWGWNALNTQNDDSIGIYRRDVNGRRLWCKREGGIWFIGHYDRSEAEKETRHSIHQCSFGEISQ